MKTRKAEVTTVTVDAEIDTPDLVGDLFARIHTYAKAHGLPTLEPVSATVTVMVSGAEWDKPRAEDFKRHIERLWLGEVRIEVEPQEFVGTTEAADGGATPTADFGAAPKA